MNYIFYIILAIITVIYDLYITKKILSVEINLKNNILIILFTIFIYALVNINSDLLYFKFPITTLLLFISLFLIFKTDIKKIIISIFVIYISLMVSEILISILLTLTNINLINVNSLQSLIINIFIYFISLLLLNLKLFRKVITYLINSNKKYDLLFIFIFILFCFYRMIPYITNIIINYKTMFIIICLNILSIIIFIISVFVNKSNQEQLINKYNDLLNYTKEYEKIIDQKYKEQHEYKNQLAMIKSMADNKKMKQYIDTILDVKVNDLDSNIINEINKLKLDGIRGLIYYKIALALNKKIDIKIDFSSNLNQKLFNKLDCKDISDLSKLIGIFMDNAIEALENVSSKQMSVTAYIDLENKLNVIIANNFESSFDIKMLGKIGYTTKGKNHGYGLSLVKDVVAKNKKIENKTEVISNCFIQNVSVNLN